MDSKLLFVLFFFPLLLTISSGDKIPNCTRFTVRTGAFESDDILINFYRPQMRSNVGINN